MKQLVDTIENMDKRGIGFRSLTEALDTTTPGGKLVFHISVPWPSLSGPSSGSGPRLGLTPRDPGDGWEDGLLPFQPKIWRLPAQC